MAPNLSQNCSMTNFMNIRSTALELLQALRGRAGWSDFIRTGTPLPSKPPILYIFSTNIPTEFF
jgi:hypothetical protein